MKLASILLTALLVTPALRASDKAASSGPLNVPQTNWVNIDSVEIPPNGHVGCYDGMSAGAKTWQRVIVHLSYSVKNEFDIARVYAYKVGDSGPFEAAAVALPHVTAGKATALATFSCDCSSGKSSYSVDRLFSSMPVEVKLPPYRSPIQRVKLTVDCSPKGPNAPAPPSPTPHVGGPRPGDSIQQKKG